MINHGDKALVSMPPEVVDKLNDVINKFVNCGLRKTLKTVEFLPLNNYELSGLQEDIKSAIENKRNFCILRDYKEYQKCRRRESINLPKTNQIRYLRICRCSSSN